jgi:glycosyltransferase involved in cell wall biosynthesis
MRIGAYFGDTNPEVGGGFTFQDEVLKALIRQVVNVPHHEFYVIGTSSSLDIYLTKLQTHANLKFLLISDPNVFELAVEWLKKGFLTFSRIFKWPGPLERLARKNRLDLVWFVAGGCFEVIDTPYIATVWDLQHKLQPWFPEVSTNGIWAGRELQYRYFLSRASYIIVGTEAGRDEVEMFYQIPKFRIFKLPHPTPSFAFESADGDVIDVGKKYNIPPNYIFYPAQFWAHKNHVNLLHAIKIIRDKYRLDLPLVLVGSDKGNAEFVKQVADDLGLSKQLYLLGFVPQADLYSLYKNAAMLAYISLCGPENLPPLEAFAVGCPVLASEVSGSLEQFGDAVLYCNPKSPEHIADKIYQLYSDNDLSASLVHKGRFRAISWTSDDFVRGVFKIADEFNTIKRNWYT